MSVLRIIRLGIQLWDIYTNYKRLNTKPKTEDESQPPPTQVDGPEHSNGGRTIYWGCVNRTYHVTGDKESMATGRRDDQAGTKDTGLKIYVACVVENYHVTTDRTT
ncbi:hypothetical protein Bbelb_087280 [Branchiostoma belcheri]|nr:hypothetical protein Bbelb_087280 [Branchiostoma belcheri]